MKERISKVRKIATIIFIGITVFGWAGTYVLAFICGPIITSEQYGEIMNTFALIYCPMAFIYILLMLCSKLFAALYQAFGDRLLLLGKKSATAFLVSAEKADNTSSGNPSGYTGSGCLEQTPAISQCPMVVSFPAEASFRRAYPASGAASFSPHVIPSILKSPNFFICGIAK